MFEKLSGVSNSVLNNTNFVTIDVSSDGISGQSLLAEYGYLTLQNASPGALGHKAYIFQTKNLVPYSGTPDAMATQPIPADQTGNVIFNNITITEAPYILCYATGDKLTGTNQQPYGNICAYQAFIYQEDGKFTVSDQQHSSINATGVSVKAVQANYTFLQGFNPAINGAWVGVWEGGQNPFMDTPKGNAALNSNASAGSWAVLVSGGIRVNEQYIVGLFTSGWDATTPNPKTMAAASMFSTG